MKNYYKLAFDSLDEWTKSKHYATAVKEGADPSLPYFDNPTVANLICQIIELKVEILKLKDN